jgi:hypothetical protein
MVALAAPGGGGRPVSRGKPAPRPAVRLPAGRVAAGVSRPRPKPAAKPRPHPVVHKATLMAKFTTPKPSKSVSFPTVGPGAKGGGGGIMTPVVPQGSKPPTRSGRVNIPHPQGPISPYANPFAASGGVTGQRIDQGVDYSGHPGRPIGAIGPGKIVSAQASGSGWPGGGFIGEQLTAGPAKGQVSYVAEDVAPTVRLGQTVKAGQQIGTFTTGGSIETGWGTLPPNVGQALAYGKQSAPGSDPGAYATGFGIAYNKLLTRLGAPSGLLVSRVSGSAPAQFSSTGGKVVGVKPTTAPRVTLPPVPALPVVSGVNPPASGGSSGGGVVTRATAAVRRPGPTGPPFKLPGPPTTGTPPPVTVPPVTTTTTSTGGTTTAPPTFISSSTGTGGIGSNVAQPVATGTTGTSSNLGKYLLVGGAALVVLLLVLRKGKTKPRQ